MPVYNVGIEESATSSQCCRPADDLYESNRDASGASDLKSRNKAGVARASPIARRSLDVGVGESRRGEVEGGAQRNAKAGSWYRTIYSSEQRSSGESDSH